MWLSTLLGTVICGVSMVMGYVLPEDFGDMGDDIHDYRSCMLLGYRRVPHLASIVGWTTLHQTCARLFQDTAPPGGRQPKRPPPNRRKDPTFEPDLTDLEDVYPTDYPSCMMVALLRPEAGRPEVRRGKNTNWAIRHRACRQMFPETAPPEGQMAKRPTLKQLNDPDFEPNFNDLEKEPIESRVERWFRRWFGFQKDPMGHMEQWGAQAKSKIQGVTEQMKSWRPTIPKKSPVPPGVPGGGKIPALKPVWI
ncbi:MAG: hypothetical protein M1823_001708 [Watsoniomyces obsoletus]|nr:MAG: hypothetical protein M1823_001708 [Watsoniomyces obsoletus]